MPSPDQAIQHHQKLIQIMNEFADNLDADLNYIEKKMAEHHQRTNSYFEGLKSHLSDLGAEVRDTMAAVSSDVTVCDRKKLPTDASLINCRVTLWRLKAP
jgi:hypothetical protein